MQLSLAVAGNAVKALRTAGNLHFGPPMPGTRRLTLIVRPPADEARLDELRAAVSALRREGHRVRVRVTFEAGDARRFARGAALAGSDTVIAAGGDGTVNEVVNGLAAAATDTRLAVLPMGTANDFARTLRLPDDDLEACLRIAVEGRTVAVDVATVNRRCFVNVSTGGFGAETSQELGRTAKRRLGRLAYLITGARRIVGFDPAHADFIADGELVHSGPFAFFAVGNGRWTGGGTRIAPEADPQDGRLDIVIATGDSRLDFLALLPAVRAGNHLEDDQVRYLRAARLEVRADRPVAVNADGELVAGRRFRYSLLDRQLPLVVPR
jgi:diacylglycerol kinase (ATP)